MPARAGSVRSLRVARGSVYSMVIWKVVACSRQRGAVDRAVVRRRCRCLRAVAWRLAAPCGGAWLGGPCCLCCPCCRPVLSLWHLRYAGPGVGASSRCPPRDDDVGALLPAQDSCRAGKRCLNCCLSGALQCVPCFCMRRRVLVRVLCRDGAACSQDLFLGAILLHLVYLDRPSGGGGLISFGARQCSRRVNVDGARRRRCRGRRLSKDGEARPVLCHRDDARAHP